jgi:hypothetical protein
LSTVLPQSESAMSGGFSKPAARIAASASARVIKNMFGTVTGRLGPELDSTGVVEKPPLVANLQPTSMKSEITRGQPTCIIAETITHLDRRSGMVARGGCMRRVSVCGVLVLSLLIVTWSRRGRADADKRQRSTACSR